MSVDLFTLTCSALSEARLVGFKGTERMSRPYAVEVFLSLPEGADARGAVGARATLKTDRGPDADPIYWHGTFVRMRLLRQVSERALYAATLVPKLWLLRHCVRSHVFTKQSLEEFLTDTLEHGGLSTGDFRFDISGQYPSEELVCQYRESHLEFFHRWLEREGLYYYFEHEADDNGKEVLVIVDDVGHHEPLSGDGRVRYFAAGGDASGGERLDELHADFVSLPASVLITDYNYANPAAPVQGEQAVSGAGGGQIRDYGYRVFDESEARRLAEVKAQSIGCRELTVHASGNASGLRAGYIFEVDDQPADLPSRLLALEVVHAGTVSGATDEVARYTGMRGDETYHVSITAIPADVQYRAPQTTQWPRIFGFENAVVDGVAESEYAQIDDDGRYLARFHFDASDLADGSACTYIRMMQPHGGSTEGHHFPLRKGTEVMVAFQGGDPDRPLIAGVVPNATHPSTVTSNNHTHNVIRTGGGNHIIMEDLADKQYIQLYTPKQCTQHMGHYPPGPVGFTTFPPAGEEMVDTEYFLNSLSGPAGFWAKSWWEIISEKKSVHVIGPVVYGYEATHSLNIGGNSDETYHAARNTIVGTGRTDKVKAGGMTQDIKGGFTQTIKPGGKSEVTGGWTHKVTAENFDDYKDWKTGVSGKWEATIGGPWTASVTDGPWTATASGNIEIKSTGGTVLIKSPTSITLDAPEVKNTAANKHLKTTSYVFEYFGSKNAWGIQKLDCTAIKIEGTGLVLSDVLVKNEIGLIKVSRGVYKDDSWALKKGAAGAKMWSGAANILSFGLTKL